MRHTAAELMCVLISAAVSIMAHLDLAGCAIATTPLQQLFYIDDEASLVQAAGLLASYGGTEKHNVILVLPPSSLVLSRPLNLSVPSTISVALRGHEAPSGNGTVLERSTLQCGDQDMGVLEISGSGGFLVSGVDFKGCSRPAIRVMPAFSAELGIENCTFKEFNRILENGRVDISRPDVPAYMTNQTTALVVHASGFAGTLRIVNSTFMDNHFHAATGAAGHRRSRSMRHNGGALSGVKGPGHMSQAEDTAYQQAGAHDGVPHLQASWAWRQLQSLDLPEQNDSSNVLLPYAVLLEPGRRGGDSDDGAWADEIEAMVAVICEDLSGGTATSSCVVQATNLVMVNNTGVATSGLFVMCDGVACIVELEDISFRDNKLLWQGAIEPDNLPQPGSIGTPAYPGTGLKLFSAMMPWLTYSYPIFYNWIMDSKFAKSGLAAYLDQFQEDSADAPLTTGRTLGAIVVQYRRSPAVGVNPLSPAMVTFTVKGGEFSGNDGAAIMTTAPDWTRIAGGLGSWPAGELMRHSADVTISGLTVNRHTSGMPPVWVRWARSVTISRVKVTESTNAVWLDEVRDSAIIECSVFQGNVMPKQRWLYYGAFIASAPREMPPIRDGEDLGAGTSHVVLVQMTASGAWTPSRVMIRDCAFDGNPAFITGTVYIVGSDRYVTDRDKQPGRASVTVTRSNFTRNYCGRGLTQSPSKQTTNPIPQPGKCYTGERPLFVQGVHEVQISSSRFSDNLNGGAYIASCRGLDLEDVAFVGNVQTYDGGSLNSDAGTGGGGLTAISIGTAGVTVRRSTFINNTSPSGGGAALIRDFSYTSITSSSFVNNSASTSDGGGLLLLESEEKGTSRQRRGSTQIDECNFTGNSAGRRGGAIATSNIAADNGWDISGCNFEGNQAMVFPLASVEGPLTRMDQAGGGAVYVENSFSLNVEDSTFVRNRVLRHAGGGIRVVDIDGMLQLKNVSFVENSAIMGGAVATARVDMVQILESNKGAGCRFINNSVTDPWSWPHSSPVPDATNETLHVPLSTLYPGYGGAVFVTNEDYGSRDGLSILYSAVFDGNTALAGGAIAMLTGSILEVVSPPRAAPWYNLTVPLSISASPGFPNLTNVYGSPDSLPYTVLLSRNAAILGGAVYVHDVKRVVFNSTLAIAAALSSTGADIPIMGSVSYKLYTYFTHYMSGTLPISPSTHQYVEHPAILFYNNTAGGGGAVYLHGNPQVDIASTRFVANKADLQLAGKKLLKIEDGDGLSLPTSQPSQAKMLLTGQPCAHGSGGSICIIGRPGGVVQVVNSELLVNTARYNGGAMYIAEGSACVTPAKCHRIHVANITVSGNTATRGQGGGIFWTSEGILSVNQCRWDAALRVPAAAAQQDQPGSGQRAPHGTVVMVPRRKPPSSWYSKLAWEYKMALLEAVGGPTANATDNMEIRMVNGSVVNLPSIPSNPLLADGSDTGYTPSRTSWVDETTWYGMPYNQLPCADWEFNSAAAGGNDIGTTPFYLLTEPLVNYYSSKSELLINITVHDWLGNNCTAFTSAFDEVDQPRIVVRAYSPLVVGTSEVLVINGSAVFKDFRVRAREGLWGIMFRGRLASPTRNLQPAQVLVSVRPCAINEYLRPDTLDECLKCKPGFYNLNPSADACQPCPENAECGYPGDGMGFMVPKVGTWHNHFFSNQILSCPNPDSCLSPNRSLILSALQVQVWQSSRLTPVNESLISGWGVDTNNTVAMRERRLQSWPQYWTPESAANETYPLRHQFASSSLLGTYSSSQCAEGYTGILCGLCKPGYGWVQVATCIECPTDKALNSFYYTLATLLTMLSLTLTIRASLGPSSSINASQPDVSRTPFAGECINTHGPAGPQHPLSNQPSSLTLRDEDGSGYFSKMLVQWAAAANHATGGTSLQTHRSSRLDGFGSITSGVRKSVSVEIGRGPLSSDRDGKLDRTAGGASGSAGSSVGTMPEVVVQMASMPIQRAADGIVLARREVSGGANAASSAPVVAPKYPEIHTTGTGVTSVREQEEQHSGAFCNLRHRVDNYSPNFSPPQLDQQCTERARSGKVHVSPVFRIAISYLQVLALLDDVHLSLSKELDVFLGVCRQATSYPGTLVSLECSLPPYLHVPKATARIFVTVFAPLYTTIGFMALYMAASVLQHGIDKRRKVPVHPGGALVYAYTTLKQQLLTAFCAIMFFFYPSVSQALFSIFHCQDVPILRVEENVLVTESVWRQDYSTQCYQGQHLALVLCLGVPGLLLFGLGWPLLNAIIVTRGTRRRGHDAQHGEASFQRMEQIADYKPRWFWWESVTLLRQLAIAAVVTFVGSKTSASVQLLIVFFLLVTAVGAQTIAQPFRSRSMGTLSLIALYGLMATVYLLVFFSQLPDAENGGRTAVSVVIIVINVALLLTFMYFPVQTYWFSLLESSGLIALDPDKRRALTYAETKERILTRFETGLSSKRTERQYSRALERFSQVRNSSLASSQAALLVLGNSLSAQLSAAALKIRISSQKIPEK